MPFAPVLQAHTNLLYNVAKDDAKNQPNALLMKSVLNRYMLSIFGKLAIIRNGIVGDFWLKSN